MVVVVSSIALLYAGTIPRPCSTSSRMGHDPADGMERGWELGRGKKTAVEGDREIATPCTIVSTVTGASRECAGDGVPRSSAASSRAPSHPKRLESPRGDLRLGEVGRGVRPVGSCATSACTGVTRHHGRSRRSTTWEGRGPLALDDEDYSWFVGIDWATDAHRVVVVDERGRAQAERSVTHAGSTIGEFTEWLVG